MRYLDGPLFQDLESNMYDELFGRPFVPGSRIAVHKCQVAHEGESESIT
jgi:hypothetical protein